MSKESNEFNELAKEAGTAIGNGGVAVDFRSVLQHFNDRAEKSGPAHRIVNTPAQDAVAEREFGERLTEVVQERIGEAVMAAKIKKMETVSKPHAQKVKALAASRKRNKPTT